MPADLDLLPLPESGTQQTISSLADLEQAAPYAVLELGDELGILDEATKQNLAGWVARRFPQFHFTDPEQVARDCRERYLSLIHMEKAVESV